MSFLTELKRRNVFKVGAAYAVMAWLVAQGVDVFLENFGTPDWVIKTVLLLLVAGFPFALFFAWVFEMTPEGIKKERDVDHSQSITHQTGRKLDFAIIAILVVALGYFAYDKFGTVNEGVTADNAAAVPVSENAEVLSESDKSIAVLPFTTRSTSEDDKFFSDGMHDDLLTQLAKIGSLKVISRTSMMEYRDTTKNLRQIGEELGVANILEGAVQRVGKQVRINVQLIDADTDEHLWAETYDREMSLDNLLDIQSEMSRAIAQAMQTTLSPQEEALLDRRMTENLKALDAYRKAKRLSEQFDAVDLARADLEIQHALDLDPEFVAAWALKAYIHMSTYWGVSYNEAQRTAAREALDRGRAIEPDSPDLDLAEGYYYYWGFLDYEAALKVLEPVLKVYPNDIELLKVLSFVNRRYGQIDVAYTYMEKAYALAPRDIRLIYTMGETKKSMREWDMAQGFLDQLQRLDPTHPRTLQLQGEILAWRDNNFQEAGRNFAMVREDTLRLGSDIWSMLIFDHDYEAALAAASFGEDKESLDGYLPPAMMRGITYVLAGERDKALQLLEQARGLLEKWRVEEPDNWYYQQSLCRTLAALKDRESTLVECNAAIANKPKDAYDLSLELEIFASAFAMAGLEDQALDILEDIAVARTGSPLSLIAANPMFNSLHNTNRWQALMREDGIQP